MTLVLRCRDAGVDCDWEARAETEEELKAKTAEHARAEHGMNEIPDDVWNKARAAIKTE
jgi:predicted small metal-binding protein